MNPSDLCYTSAADLAALIRSRKLSPVEVTQAFLDRIAALDPKLNTFATLTAETALAAARQAEGAVLRGERLGPLHGVPVTIKDFIDVAGVRTGRGSKSCADDVAARDSVEITRLRQAGAILLGKTTAPEFGWKAIGDSPLTGITRNPWNLAHTAGGSSSGAAAGIAAGLSPLALGSDGAGSIRVPCAFNGIFGLKPSYGRIPIPGQASSQVAHNGPLTRTVADAALMLGVLAGPDDTDVMSLEGQPDDYVGRLHEGVRGWRIAWSPDLGHAQVDPEVRDLTAKAARAFETAGATVEEVRNPWPDPQAIIEDLWLTSYAARFAPLLPRWEAQMDPGLVALVKEGLGKRATTFPLAMSARWQWWAEHVHPFFQRYDLFLTPSVAVPALKIGELIPAGYTPHAWNWLRWAPFSYPFNLTGQPAATVPAGFTEAGLPAGLQIVGRRFADLAVLQAAAVFERVQPWADKRPAI